VFCKDEKDENIVDMSFIVKQNNITDEFFRNFSTITTNVLEKYRFIFFH